MLTIQESEIESTWSTADSSVKHLAQYYWDKFNENDEYYDKKTIIPNGNMVVFCDFLLYTLNDSSMAQTLFYLTKNMISEHHVNWGHNAITRLPTQKHFSTQKSTHNAKTLCNANFFSQHINHRSKEII